MPSESLQDLAREHEREGLGPLIQRRVRALVQRVGARYPPHIYARSGRWDEETLQDLVQDVYAELLDGQLATILDYVRTIAGFDVSIRELTRDLLSQRKQRTLIDNLIDRAREAVKTEPFVSVGQGADLRFSLPGFETGTGALSEAELREAAQRVVVLPRMPMRTVERAPRVYRSETLATLLKTIAQVARRPVGLTDLRRILGVALTDLAVSELQYRDDGLNQDNEPEFKELGDLPQHSEGAPGMAEPRLDPETAVLASQVADAMIAAFTQEQRTVVRLKFAGTADAEIAAALGISRPTAAKRKDEALETLKAHLEGLDDRETSAVIDCLLTRLVEEASE